MERDSSKVDSKIFHLFIQSKNIDSVHQVVLGAQGIQDVFLVLWSFILLGDIDSNLKEGLGDHDT